MSHEEEDREFVAKLKAKLAEKKNPYQEMYSELGIPEPPEPPKAKSLEKVGAAMSFINLCNNYTQPQNIINPSMEGEGLETLRIEKADLPYAQEAAFNFACQYIGEFFADGCERKKTRHPEIEWAGSDKRPVDVQEESS